MIIAGALEALDSVVACHQSRRSQKADIERDDAGERSIKDHDVFEKGAAEITGQVVSALRSDMATQERLDSLDRATHCLDTMMWVLRSKERFHSSHQQNPRCRHLPLEPTRAARGVSTEGPSRVCAAHDGVQHPCHLEMAFPSVSGQ